MYYLETTIEQDLILQKLNRHLYTFIDGNKVIKHVDGLSNLITWLRTTRYPLPIFTKLLDVMQTSNIYSYGYGCFKIVKQN